MTRQFVLFLFAGATAALLHWGSRIWLNRFLDFSTALVLAYAVGVAAAFVLNKLLVFPLSGRNVRSEIRWFVFFNVAAFPVVWGASMVLADPLLPWLGIRWHVREIAHAIAISLPLVFNFYLHKFITFREAPEGS